MPRESGVTGTTTVPPTNTTYKAENTEMKQKRETEEEKNKTVEKFDTNKDINADPDKGKNININA